MCGIAGIIKKAEITEDDKNLVELLNQKLVHRGPNSAGFWDNKHASIAMRRLSIIDIEGGVQPIFNEDKSIVLITNGEIYNFIELRESLLKKGATFKSNSDSETIIRAYEIYGESFIKELRGMFAFCLVDNKKERAFIVRDRIGEKPLYIIDQKDSLIFSSEMKSLIQAIPEKERQINERSLYTYLHYGYVPEPTTLIKGVRKLGAGEMIEIDFSPFKIQFKKYWQYADIEKIEGDSKILIRNELEEIERIIIRSDVPIGVSLSGGIDSSLIAILSNKNAKDKLHAFSVGYPDTPANDERKAAQSLSTKLGFKFHDIEIKKEEFINDFDSLIYSMDDPIADIAAYGYYRVSKEANKNNVPVVLSGIGGDELFWGYEWMRQAVHYNILKRTLFGKVKLFFILLKKSFWSFKRKPIQTLINVGLQSLSSSFLLFDLTSSFRRISSSRKKIFTKEFLLRIDPLYPESLFNSPSTGNEALSACEKLNTIWLYSNSIALGDRTSMAHSVELRMPLVDYKLTELVLGLRRKEKNDYKLGFKYWLIEAIKDIVPKETLDRPKKGFEPPTGEWVKEIVLKKQSIVKNGYINRKNIINKNFLEEITTEPGPFHELLYRLVVLETWIQLYAPNNS